MAKMITLSTIEARKKFFELLNRSAYGKNYSYPEGKKSGYRGPH